MDNECKKQMWRSFGWDKINPDGYEAIGTPEFEAIMQKRKEQKEVLERREWFKVRIYFPKSIANGIVWDDEIQGTDSKDALQNAYQGSVPSPA